MMMMMMMGICSLGRGELPAHGPSYGATQAEKKTFLPAARFPLKLRDVPPGPKENMNPDLKIRFGPSNTDNKLSHARSSQIYVRAPLSEFDLTSVNSVRTSECGARHSSTFLT
jgi:hypothetical protein